MAPDDALAAQELADELEQARADAGYPSFAELARLVYDELGTPISDEAIRKYHRGKVALTGISIPVMCVLAKRYSRSVSSFSPILGARLKAEKRVLLAHTRMGVPAESSSHAVLTAA